MITRGVLYVVWPGVVDPEPLLQRSIESLVAIHPELPYHICRLPEGSGLLHKSMMADLSPFDTTLFLDADTVVMGNIDAGFAKAERYGLACCICECPWARRYAGLADRPDLIEYNTGVIFWNRRDARATDVFRGWKANVGIDSSCAYRDNEGVKRMAMNDQASFALAVEEAGFNPAVLPLNWNFRPLWQTSMFGLVKIYHDYSDVPQALLDWNASQSGPDATIDCARVA